MSTILVNNVKSYTGETVTISGSNISVHGNSTLGDGAGGDTITVRGHLTASGNISASGTVFADNFQSAGGDDNMSFTDNINLTGHLTASGQGVFGGLVSASGFFTNGDITATNATAHFLNVTASSISSSGTITATSYAGTLSTSTQASITSLGVLTGLEVADGASISGSNLKLEGSASVVGHVSASSFSAVAGTGSFGKIVGTLLSPAQTNIQEVGVLQGLQVADSLTISGSNLRLEGSASVGVSLDVQGPITASILQSLGEISGSTITVDKGGGFHMKANGDQGSTTIIDSIISGSNIKIHGSASFLGHVSASSDATVAGTGSFGKIIGTLLSPAQTNVTSVGSLTSLNINPGTLTVTGQATLAGGISGSNLRLEGSASVGGTVSAGTGSFGGTLLEPGIISGSNLKLEGSASVVGHVSASSFAAVAGTGSFGKIVGTLLTAAQTNITQVGTLATLTVADQATISGSNLRLEGSASIDAVGGLTFDKTVLSNGDIATISGSNSAATLYTSQLQAAIADGAFAEFKIQNTAIKATSHCIAAIVNGFGTITGSILTAASLGAGTASLQIHNETGVQIADDSGFTASLLIL